MQTTKANVVTEFRFEAKSPHADPFNAVTLDAVFSDPNGAQFRVPAFWAGGSSWKVRYASGLAGVHEFQTECSVISDSGLHGVTGSVVVEPYTGDNPLYRHGAIRVAADQRHLEHADGESFLWLGDTWWMGLSKRLTWPEDFQTLTADRIRKGFNLIQIVAGLYPDQGAFDERSANETGFAWETDYCQIRPAYFDAADERLSYLVEQGLVPCIIGAWGYHLPWLGAGKMKQHMRHLIARYGAMPVIWCVAGEFNLPYYLTPGFPEGGEAQAEDWEPIIEYVRSLNAFPRLVTVHPTGLAPCSGRLVLKNPALIDFDMLQTGHGDGSVSPTVHRLQESLDAAPPKPVVNAEVAYEALAGVAPPMKPEIPRMVCWISLLSGAAGHTYGANGIWQLNRKGKPYGHSPNGVFYGDIPWDEAMHLPGGKEVALAGNLLSSLPFEHFEPHREWADFVMPNDDYLMIPYAAGIQEKVRVIYVPTAGAIVVRGLEPGISYEAAIFDPVTGDQTDLGSIAGDSKGCWQPPIPTWDHDWVLILKASQSILQNPASD